MKCPGACGYGLVKNLWCWYGGLGGNGGHWLLNLAVGGPGMCGCW